MFEWRRGVPVAERRGVTFLVVVHPHPRRFPPLKHSGPKPLYLISPCWRVRASQERPIVKPEVPLPWVNGHKVCLRDLTC